MRRSAALAAGAIGLALAAAASAGAPDSPAWIACRGGGRITADQQIAGCTEVTKAKDLPPAAAAAAYYQRAVLKESRRDLAGAVADLSQAVRLVPGFADAYVRRGNTYYVLGDRAHAIDDYSRAIALKPQAAVLYNNRCWARAESGTTLEAALADCDQAIRLQPSFAAAFGSRAYVHFRLGRFDQAIADADAAARMDSQSNGFRAGALYIRGVAELRTGDLGGQLDIATAQEIDPNVAATYAARGVAP